MKFCEYFGSLCPHVCTNFGWFILIFSKMVSIFIRGLIVFIASTFDFHRVKLPYFIANNELSPVHQTSILWIIRLGDNAGALSQAATEIKAKNSSQVQKCTSVDSVCVTGESHWQLWQIQIRENDSPKFSLIASLVAQPYWCNIELQYSTNMEPCAYFGQDITIIFWHHANVGKWCVPDI